LRLAVLFDGVFGGGMAKRAFGRKDTE